MCKVTSAAKKVTVKIQGLIATFAAVLAGFTSNYFPNITKIYEKNQTSRSAF